MTTKRPPICPFHQHLNKPLEGCPQCSAAKIHQQWQDIKDLAEALRELLEAIDREASPQSLYRLQPDLNQARGVMARVLVLW